MYRLDCRRLVRALAAGVVEFCQSGVVRKDSEGQRFCVGCAG
jgi:hypothetical protein